MTQSLTLSRLSQRLTALLQWKGRRRSTLRRLLAAQGLRQLRNPCPLTAILNGHRPLLETRKVRRGARNFDVPFPLKRQRSLSLLLRWWAKAARSQGLGRWDPLQQLRQLAEDRGPIAGDAKNLRQRVAQNLMYSHYRWGR